ncbi:MAG: PASTA domain-containing protein [Pyramidobacter sp.]|jgi:beta-lactam-binding protein with PASTA domain
MNKTFRITLALVLLCIMGSALYVSYKVFFSNPTRSIPMLKGTAVVEAVQTLERMGVKARIDEEESSLPRGTVIGQWPETGVRLRADKIVILKVSRGADKVSLPDMRGMTQIQAVQRLQEMGFVVGEIQKIYHQRPAGVVIAQNPASPVSIPLGREVGLLVSLGPAAANGGVIVPDLTERTEGDAVQIARESSLRPSVEYEYALNSPKGMVIRMTPAAGSRVSAGTTVTLRVASWDRRYAPQAVATSPDQQNDEKSSGNDRVKVIAPNEGKVVSTPPADRSHDDSAVRPPEPQTPPAAAKKKVAAIRYQAPPIKNQTLRIELVDRAGERVLLDRKVEAGEFIKIDEPYTGEAVVTIYLGGTFVWSDRYK